MLDPAVGCVASAGKKVRKLAAVGFVMVTLVTKPLAPEGIVQFPCVPTAAMVAVSPGPNGRECSPTWLLARVSSSRHGVIETNEEGAVEAPAML
jgi:hypothetical protein